MTDFMALLAAKVLFTTDSYCVNLNDRTEAYIEGGSIVIFP